MNVATIGIDLAKNTFSLHGTDAQGKTVLKKTISRSKLLACFANLPPCVVGMEACTGAHHWVRELRQLGHDARIIAPRSSSRSNPANSKRFYACIASASRWLANVRPSSIKSLAY